MVVYYVGKKGDRTGGQAGCIGCVCRPDRDRIVSRFEWIPNGNDPDFKHCIVEKTKRNIMQGKVRR